MILSAYGKTKWVVAVTEVSTIRRSVSGEKQNSLRNLKILPGIGILGEFWGSHDVIKSNIWEILDFLRISPKMWDNIRDFQDNFFLHVVLLKQHLLELSPISYDLICKKDILYLKITTE